MLDGLVYGETESDKSVVVTTDSLLDKWLLGHRDLWSKDNTPIAGAAAAAIKTEDFYARAVNTDSAVAHYAELPVVAPPGAKFAYATLSLIGNGDLVPGAPDRIFVALEQNGRVFIVDEKLATAVPPIPACDGAGADYTKKAEATDKAFMAGGGKNKKLLDAVEKLRSQADHAVCACFADKVKGTPAYNAAVSQAAAIVAALTREVRRTDRDERGILRRRFTQSRIVFSFRAHVATRGTVNDRANEANVPLPSPCSPSSLGECAAFVRATRFRGRLRRP